MSTIVDKTRRAIELFFDFRYLAIVGYILFLIVLSVAIYLIYQSSGIMRDRINKDFNEQQLILARQASSQIDGILHDIETELKSLSHSFATIPNAVDFRLAMQEMALRTEHKGVIEVGVLDLSGQQLYSYVVPGFQSLPIKEIEEACRLEDPWQPFPARLYVEHIDQDSSNVKGILCTNILSNKSARITLYVRLDLSNMVGAVTRDIRSGRTGYAWVIDETGMFIYHPEHDFINKNAFTARYERRPYISFTQINDIMRNQMLKGEEGTGVYESGWHRGVEGKMTKLIAFTPVHSSVLSAKQVWSVAVAAPISEVAEATHQVYVRQLFAEAAIIAGLFVFGIMSAVYHRRISRALKNRVNLQEELITSILQNSVDAIIFIDNDNRVKVWNRGATLIFGYRADEMIGQTFHRLVPPDIDADEELQHIQEEVNKNGYIRNYRAQRMTKDGRRITIDLSRTAIHSNNEEIIGSTAIIKDVTEKMELEQKIYNTEKLASIGILAAGVAHEINNPLAIILGFNDLLLERFKPGSPEFEDLKMIEENANHARKIVENLLGFARITEGHEDTIDIVQSLQTVAGIVKNTLMTKKIVLSMADLPVSLPRVGGDAREFQQVIFNLINNAAAAMEKGGGILTLLAQAESGWVNVSVTDTGIGISEKIKQRIFDPFFTTKKVGEGTGLGLSLCYGIMKKYGGKINFSSSSAEDFPDRPSGSTFVISLPIMQSHESEKGGDE